MVVFNWQTPLSNVVPDPQDVGAEDVVDGLLLLPEHAIMASTAVTVATREATRRIGLTPIG